VVNGEDGFNPIFHPSATPPPASHLGSHIGSTASHRSREKRVLCPPSILRAGRCRHEPTASGVPAQGSAASGGRLAELPAGDSPHSGTHHRQIEAPLFHRSSFRVPLRRDSGLNVDFSGRIGPSPTADRIPSTTRVENDPVLIANSSQGAATRLTCPRGEPHDEHRTRRGHLPRNSGGR
jgi:hypothetical protein